MAGPARYSWTSLWSMETPVMRPKARRKLATGPARATSDALPAGMVVEVAGVVGGLVFAGAHLAGHLDVAAEGEAEMR